MANKNVARQRWKKSIRDHIEAVPEDAVKRNPTLVYRLRGEGYYFDQETGWWYYETNEEKRNALILDFKKERAQARSVAREQARLQRDERRKRTIKIVSDKVGRKRQYTSVVTVQPD